MFTTERFQMGDLVYAKEDLLSDGHIPETEAGQLVVPKGRRGVVLRVGHAEQEPEVAIYLVQFEDAQAELGPIMGCLTHELTQPIS